MPYSLIINQESKLFKFPDISSMTKYLDINNSCEHINKISKPKSVFNENELERIERSYCKDLEIYNNIV
jgi:hypothetical protein